MTRTIFTHFDDVPREPHVVSIGTFDGVHRGHRHLLGAALARSRQLGLSLLVVTFEPIPAQVIRPERFQGRLITAERKLEILRGIGDLDVLVLPFTEALMMQGPEPFMEGLHRAVMPAELWIGEGFALGHNRTGTVERLAQIGSELGFDVRAARRLTIDGDVISSSRIRKHILDGKPECAETLLGYLFGISGEVIAGAQVGRQIGFPTANVLPPPGLVALPDGIYASYAIQEAESEPRPAVTYIGTRPALNSGERLIETHILDFDGDLYGQQLRTDFVRRLRPDATFDSLNDLIAQLRSDEAHARQVLTARSGQQRT